MLKDLVLRNRSYRRFDQSTRIAPETLRGLVDLARLTPSARNCQPLKYLLIHNEETCAKMFPFLMWAGYLKDWDGPVEGERPSAYVVVLGDTSIANTYNVDPGIAAQTLLLGAVEEGLGGCILASVQRQGIREAFEVAEKFEILYVIALGKPVEVVVLEDLQGDGDIKYWRDEKQVHHVPKRGLKDVIVGEK